MAMRPQVESQINPWVRADLERFNAETLALIPDADRLEYAAVMQQLAGSKAVLGVAQERLQQAEQNRHAFFDRIIYGIAETPPAAPTELDITG